MTRRGYVVAALGVLVLVLAALTVVPRVLDGDGDAAVEPFSADDYDRVDGPLTCDTEVKEVPALPLEAEPMALLVCADPDGSMPWTAPADLVKGDLSDLVDVLSDLEPTPDEPYDCTFQGGPGYDLLLRFSRGRYARIHGDTGGCGVVSTAARDYFGADEVLDAALTLVETQRSARPAPTAFTARPRCPELVDGLGPAVSLTGEMTDVVVAVSCWRPDAKEVGAWRGPVPIARRDLRPLLRDLARADDRPATTLVGIDCPGGRRTLYHQVLLGRTAWGDLVAMYGQCHEFSVPAPRLHPSEVPLVWHPSPRAERILDRLRR